jgi:hypothetical protein
MREEQLLLLLDGVDVASTINTELPSREARISSVATTIAAAF